MKKKLLLSIFAVLAVAAAITYSSAAFKDVTECPQTDPLNYTVLLPNPGDCGSFFVCNRGVAILVPCPDGLHFCVETQTCAWPEIANCEGKAYCDPYEGATCSLIMNLGQGSLETLSDEGYKRYYTR